MRTAALSHCHNNSTSGALNIRSERAGVFSLTAIRDNRLGGDKIVFQNYVTMIMGVVGLIVLRLRYADIHPFKNRRVQVFATRSSLTFQHFPTKLLHPRQTDSET